MAAMYAILLRGFLFVFFGDASGLVRGRIEGLITGVMVLGICVPLCAAFTAGIFLKPAPWVWVYDIVLIAIGLTSCLTMIASIPLLIQWLKPEVQRYFGRSA
jgi:hypothetical protein